MGTKGVAFNCSGYGIVRAPRETRLTASCFHFRICFVFFDLFWLCRNFDNNLLCRPCTVTAELLDRTRIQALVLLCPSLDRRLRPLLYGVPFVAVYVLAKSFYKTIRNSIDYCYVSLDVLLLSCFFFDFWKRLRLRKAVFALLVRTISDPFSGAVLLALCPESTLFSGCQRPCY